MGAFRNALLKHTQPKVLIELEEWWADGLPTPKDDGERLQLQVLAAAVFIAMGLAVVFPEMMQSAVDPLGIGLVGNFALLAVMRQAEAAINDSLSWVLDNMNLRKLPSRPDTDKVAAADYASLDRFYFRLNGILDLLFVANTLQFMSSINSTPEASEMTLSNTIGAFVVLMVGNEALYLAYHKLLHCNKFLYRAIHAHHHATKLPDHAYTDGRNYHPLEFLGAFVSALLMYRVVAVMTGIHLIPMTAYIVATTVSVTVQHSRYEIKVDAGFFSYYSGDHEMHHRVPTCNFGLYTVWMDRLVGYYLPYNAGTTCPNSAK